MTRNKSNPAVDSYLANAERWQEEMRKLRELILSSPLSEELKWGKPCYVYEGRNVVLIIGFKHYCALLFCKGALLKDPDQALVKAGENTQAARHLRFASLGEVKTRADLVKSYVKEAVELEKAGVEVTYKKISEFAIPPELEKEFRRAPALKRAFQALTPGRQRGYLLFFGGAKQAATREARIAKYVPHIMAGKGMQDPAPK